MHITLNIEPHDFAPDSPAARTLRAISVALDSNAAPAPLKAPGVLSAASTEVLTPAASAITEGHASSASVGYVEPSGTVATHVSALAAGDVPFADEPPAHGGVDAKGYPWDERIHASSRATVSDGTWRMKRGVSDELVAQVRAEWDAKLKGEPTEAERLEEEQAADLLDPATVGFGSPAVPPPPPAAAEWPAAELGPRDPAKTEFQQFVGWAMGQMSLGAFTNERLLAVLQANDVPILPALAQPEQAAKIGAIVAQLTGA